MSEVKSQQISFCIDLKVMGQNLSLKIHEEDTKQSIIQKLSEIQRIGKQQSKLVMDKLIQHLKQSLQIENQLYSPRLKACIAAFLCRTTTNRKNKKQQSIQDKQKQNLKVNEEANIKEQRKRNKKPSVRQILGNSKLTNSKPIKTQVSEDLIKAYEAVYRKSRNSTFKFMAQQFLGSKAQTIFCQINIPNYMKQSKSSSNLKNNKKIKQIINKKQQRQQKQSSNKQQNQIKQHQKQQEKHFHKNRKQNEKFDEIPHKRKYTEKQEEIDHEISYNDLEIHNSQLLTSYLKPYQYLSNQQFSKKDIESKQFDKPSEPKRKKYQYLIS